MFIENNGLNFENLQKKTFHVILVKLFFDRGFIERHAGKNKKNELK